MEKSQLLSSISQDDPYAMLAALDRKDFTMNENVNVAQRLLYLGYTGKALQSLIIMEMVGASLEYSSNQEALTEPAVKHLLNALAYANYGLSKKDAIGLVQIANMVQLEPLFQIELNPFLILNEQETQDINALSDGIRNEINVQRINNGLPPLTTSTNKIAEFQLRQDIGRVFAVLPNIKNKMKLIFGDLVDVFPSKECEFDHKAAFVELSSF